MKSGRAQWQKAEEKRKDFNIVLIHQDKKFFTSELFKVIQDATSLILHYIQCINSERFLRVHSSHRMCDQFTLHHEFRIDTGRTKILSKRQTVFCGVLGRHQPCSKERILVLSNTIERNHPLRHTPSLLYPEGYHDGKWRNHIREILCVTSTSSEDFLSRQLEERIGFRSCWRY